MESLGFGQEQREHAVRRDDPGKAVGEADQLSCRLYGPGRRRSNQPL